MYVGTRKIIVFTRLHSVSDLVTEFAEKQGVTPIPSFPEEAPAVR